MHDLVVNDVRIGYERKTIIDSLGFSVAPGKFHTILGPNGSGKSTLLKAITGELAHAGHIVLSGLAVGNATPDTMAQVRGVLPQQSGLSFPLNVAEVVNLGILKHSKCHNQHERQRRISEALSLVDLGGFEKRVYQTLSGGEQQRVQLARVLCQVWEPVSNTGRPCWLFLDEPVSSLDIKHQVQIMEVAADYARRGGGVLAIMHDLNLTASYADTVMVLGNGRILASGTVEEVYRDDILSEAFDYKVRVTRVDGHNAPVVLTAPYQLRQR
ncbi:heme ABC transporter ATP-binding protein [Roseibium sp.]|uniref:heme ABC transporter ATP-binding protein n=1 Tax=Roseibium sp. TaxID=1936156 RepID=UPI003A97C7C7